MEKIKVTLPNGLTLEGQVNEINDVLKNLDCKIKDRAISDDLYLSSSKGVMKISEMNIVHLKNAILKHYESWLSDLRDLKSDSDLFESLVNGPNHLVPLMKELEKRVKL